jgi:hypothetical protein
MHSPRKLSSLSGQLESRKYADSEIKGSEELSMRTMVDAFRSDLIAEEVAVLGRDFRQLGGCCAARRGCRTQRQTLFECGGCSLLLSVTAKEADAVALRKETPERSGTSTPTQDDHEPVRIQVQGCPYLANC